MTKSTKCFARSTLLNQLVKMTFFARDPDLMQLLKDLETKNKTITLLIGESGCGKSKLLDEYYERIKINYSENFFIGYYNSEKSLISESMSYVYPVSICLNSLIENILETLSMKEKVESQITRLERAFNSFFKEQGKELLVAIIEDLAKKVGLEKTTTLVKKFYDTFKDTKTAIKLGTDMLSNHKEEIFGMYLNIFKVLSDEFPDRQFILIFDQFEYVGKTSVDFLLNLIKMLPEKFHIIIAFKTEERRWEDESVRKLFEDTRDKIVYDLKGKSYRIEGLSTEQIGEWIFADRNRRLPLVPDLTRIKENSAGLPVILEQWIKESQDLRYDEIKIDNHCEQLNKLINGLSDADKVILEKLSVMLDPVSTNFLVSYFNVTEEQFDLFIHRMVKQGLFDAKKKWFRHELIKKCIEDYELSDEIRKHYHEQFADFCEGFPLYPNKLEYDDNTLKIHIEYAYHLHNSDRYEKSFVENNNLAGIAELAGRLDLAERCYKRAIFAGSKIENPSINKLAACHSDLGDIYIVWGRFDEALDNYSLSLGYYSDIGDELNVAAVLNLIGITFDHKGNHEKSLVNYEDALKISTRLNDEHNIAQILLNMGVIFDKDKKHSEALRLYEESLVLSRKNNDVASIVRLLINIGIVLADTDRPDEALVKFEESFELLKKMNDQRALAAVLVNMGNIYDQKGQYNEAMGKHEESLKISRRLGDERGVAATLGNIGIVLRRKGDLAGALKKYEEALTIFMKLGDEYHIALTTDNIRRLKA